MSFIARIPHLRAEGSKVSTVTPLDVNGLLNSPSIDSVSFNPLTKIEKPIYESKKQLKAVFSPNTEYIPDVTINFSKWTNEILFETAHNFFFENITEHNTVVLNNELREK